MYYLRSQEFIPVVTLLLLASEALLVTGAFVAAALLALRDADVYFTAGSGIFSVGLVVLSISSAFTSMACIRISR